MRKALVLMFMTVGLSLSLVAGNGNGNHGNGNGNGGDFGDAPEIDPSSAVSGLALLGGAVLMIRGARAKQ